MLSEMILRYTDNLGRTSQIARLVVDTLLTVRNDESFDLFLAKAEIVFTTFG